LQTFPTTQAPDIGFAIANDMDINRHRRIRRLPDYLCAWICQIDRFRKSSRKIAAGIQVKKIMNKSGVC
jgi:hypothetical protein